MNTHYVETTLGSILDAACFLTTGDDTLTHFFGVNVDRLLSFQGKGLGALGHYVVCRGDEVGSSNDAAGSTDLEVQFRTLDAETTTNIPSVVGVVTVGGIVCTLGNLRTTRQNRTVGVDVLDCLHEDATVCLELNVRSRGVTDNQSFVLRSVVERELMTRRGYIRNRILILLIGILNFRSSTHDKLRRFLEGQKMKSSGVTTLSSFSVVRAVTLMIGRTLHPKPVSSWM